jgi:hypothetical protein
MNHHPGVSIMFFTSERSSAMRVSNPDSSPVGINRRYTAQLQPALLRLSAMISHYFFTHKENARFDAPCGAMATQTEQNRAPLDAKTLIIFALHTAIAKISLAHEHAGEFREC